MLLTCAAAGPPDMATSFASKGSDAGDRKIGELESAYVETVIRPAVVRLSQGRNAHPAQAHVRTS